MSMLADYYREVNFNDGHKSNCGWGAGADCSCGKFVREARQKYRSLQEASTLSKEDFRMHVDLLIAVWAAADMVDEYDMAVTPHDVYLRAAKQISPKGPALKQMATEVSDA